jgi:CRP-like cAMP-binding protein
MTASGFLVPRTAVLTRRRFARRSLLPLEPDYLWQIETGVVRTLTCNEEGAFITLGVWGPGDVVGSTLSKADPYQIECLTLVETTLLPRSRWHEATPAMIQHIQKSQELLEIVHSKSVDIALLKLLAWLANRFGHKTEQGQLIDLRLTHQEISELIGATRVTVTRVLNEFERRGVIQRMPHRFIVLQDSQPLWHYEI